MAGSEVKQVEQVTSKIPTTGPAKKPDCEKPESSGCRQSPRCEKQRGAQSVKKAPEATVDAGLVTSEEAGLKTQPSVPDTKYLINTTQLIFIFSIFVSLLGIY